MLAYNFGASPSDCGNALCGSTSALSPILNIIFYLALLVFMVYSLLAIYALLKQGRTKTIGIVVSLVYLALAAAIYFTGLIHLHSI